MLQMLAVRLDDALLARVDAERKRRGLSRARVIREALGFWLAPRLLEEAVREEHAAYARRPVRTREFGPIIGAQVWPK
jgi:metal-responsive CopG/Arc/MetJ family transcriptional regulator